MITREAEVAEADVSAGDTRDGDLHLSVLATLADRFRELDDPEQIAFVATETLGLALGVSRAGYGTIDTQAETIHIRRDWNAPGIASISGTLHFRDYGSYIDDLSAGRTVVIEDAWADPRTAATAANLSGIAAESFVNMPVTERGGFVALLFLNHHRPRVWPDSELQLIREVADRTRSVVARREAEAAVRTSERRLHFLDDLGQATARAKDAETVLAITTRMLGEHLRVSSCAYADVESDEDMFNIRGDWHSADAPSIVGRYSLATFGTLAVRNLSAGAPLVVNDNIAELGEDGSRAFLDIGIRATICMPFVREGRLSALMAIHDAQPRHWTDAELALLNEVTERSWAHIERVRAEAALVQSERRLRLAIESARMGTWDWDLTTAQGTWSPRTAEIMGFDSGENITPEMRYRSIHPDDRDWVQAAVVRSLQSGEEFSTEYRVLRPDGETRWISSRGIVERDDTGRSVRTIGTVRDVTDRRTTQEALKSLNETLEQQVAQRTAERDGMWRLSNDLFLVVGRRWDIVSVNPAVTTLLGYDEAEVVGRRFSHYVHADDLREVAGFIRAAAVRPVQDFHARLRASDGSWRQFAWSAAPGGRQAYVIGRDITVELRRRAELETAQEALRQTQKVEALGQVTGGVAHDFNNLLTPILGSLDLVRRNAALGSRDHRLLDAALESAERARILVQRLLAFARRQPLKPGPVDLEKLVGGMTELISSTSGPRIKVVVDIAPGLPPALADANQLEMAILNLSVNARDAMPDGGTLTIAARETQVAAGARADLAAGGYLGLSVADTGVGMDEATMARAIEPFFSTKGIGKGTGLGLSMVHGLASQMGGAMALSSTPGRGTVVDLLIPIAVDVAYTEHRAPAPNAHRGNGMVLLVDDEAAVRSATRELLIDLGYSVVEADSGETALAMLDHATVDYLVTDHLMPGLSGTELARAARARVPGLRVLVVSGYAELEGISSDLHRLAKPFRRDELAESLAAL